MSPVKKGLRIAGWFLAAVLAVLMVLALYQMVRWRFFPTHYEKLLRIQPGTEFAFGDVYDLDWDTMVIAQTVSDGPFDENRWFDYLASHPTSRIFPEEGGAWVILKEGNIVAGEAYAFYHVPFYMGDELFSGTFSREEANFVAFEAENGRVGYRWVG